MNDDDFKLEIPLFINLLGPYHYWLFIFCSFYFIFSQIPAYNFALRSQVDCIEIDVSRSSDGVLFALHDR